MAENLREDNRALPTAKAVVVIGAGTMGSGIAEVAVNYPIGPMAWGQLIGLPYVGTVLQHLARAYGEDRYRSSLWLQRAVHAAQVLGAQHD